jgi:hypothetical protein
MLHVLFNENRLQGLCLPLHKIHFEIVSASTTKNVWSENVLYMNQNVLHMNQNK